MSVKYTEVATLAAYAATPDVEALFEPNRWIFTYVSGGDALFSFDGVNDHGRVRATFVAPFIMLGKYKKVWLKQVAGASTVAVAAATDV